MPNRAYLSACLTFKDSALYLAEWLAFHSIQGVEHFYLYNNESSDHWQPIVEPYVRRGLATVIDFPGKAVQLPMYQHCLRNYGPRTRWLTFNDDDEFLFPVEEVPLSQVLARYERYAGVAVPWMLYGSSGHQTRPPGLVVRNYVRRMSYPDRHVKCIVNPAKVIHPIASAHLFHCVPGECVVDENEKPLNEALHPYPQAKILRINHYLTKSIEEMEERRGRKITVDTGKVSALPITQWRQLEADRWNEVEDWIAARYADQVEASLRELSAPFG
ncbi:MAG TPA: glycosyltransferase family 92 protein [Opitutaceae bacterium]